MRTAPESMLGMLVLTLCHIAGMLDLVILPLWVGGMMQDYKLDPQIAGGLVTLYLIGTLVANAALARSYGRLPDKLIAVLGFAVPALAFVLMTQLPAVIPDSVVPMLAVLHFVGGLGAGAGLVVIHGMIGRSGNPHRLFAVANFGVSFFALVFFALTPNLMKTLGVNAVFLAAALVAAIACLAAIVALPKSEGVKPAAGRALAPAASTGILALCFLGVVFLQTGNAVTLSFVERVGAFRGFDKESIGIMLAGAGVVPLIAPVIAALLQNKLSPLPVAVAGLVFHGVLSAIVSTSPTFVPYAVAYSLVISTVIFVHTFVFGLLARLDPSGKTNAATPSMLMIGTAIGPILGGTVAKFVGYPAVGLTAAASAALGACCFIAVAYLSRSRSVMATQSV